MEMKMNHWNYKCALWHSGEKNWGGRCRQQPQGGGRVEEQARTRQYLNIRQSNFHPQITKEVFLDDK